MTKVLESLVADNEALKRDNAELQNILTETREDLRTLQEELDERRAHEEPVSRHRHTSSTASSIYQELSPTSPTFRFSTGPIVQRSVSAKAGPSFDHRRSISVERPRRVFVCRQPVRQKRTLISILGATYTGDKSLGCQTHCFHSVQRSSRR